MLNLQDFNFDLPQTSIALRPVSPRDTARLLTVDPKASPSWNDSAVNRLVDYLKPGDVLVFNDTKVLPAQLQGIRCRDIEIQAQIALKGHLESSLSLDDTNADKVLISMTLIDRLDRQHWLAFAMPGRRLRVGDQVAFGDDVVLIVEIIEKRDDGSVVIRSQSNQTIDDIMFTYGKMPIPPYIAKKRTADDRDRHDYQTIYAKDYGAVAAPTAGLHFTEDLMAQIKTKGVKMTSVTLHVGLGTFLPIKNNIVDAHTLHEERYEVSEETAQTINNAKGQGGRIVVVGTTTLRTLESLAQNDGAIAAMKGSTDIFIKPGHRFKTADLLMTNFHLPKSTLFMLVCAFSGLDVMQAAYAHAIQSGYRFYSYGDACLLTRAAN